MERRKMEQLNWNTNQRGMLGSFTQLTQFQTARGMLHGGRLLFPAIRRCHFFPLYCIRHYWSHRTVRDNCCMFPHFVSPIQFGSSSPSPYRLDSIDNGWKITCRIISPSGFLNIFPNAISCCSSNNLLNKHPCTRESTSKFVTRLQ